MEGRAGRRSRIVSGRSVTCGDARLAPGSGSRCHARGTGLLRRRPVPALRPAATRRAARVERAARLLGRVETRRRRRDLARSRDVLLGQGDPHLRDRCRVPEPADDDAHRPARPHALPQARAAGLRAVAHAGTGRAGARTRRRTGRARRGGCRVRRGRADRGAVPAVDHRRTARHPGVGLAPLLPLVGSGDPRGNGLAARRMPAAAGGDARVPARDHAHPAGRPARTTSSPCSRAPRSTASR